MKRYLDLIPLYAKVHKRQNRMTLLCIVFSVFLVCAIFSMAEMATVMELDRLNTKHGTISLGDVLDTTMGQTLFLTAAVLFVLILMAGVLMISGSMNSTIAQRTRFFGMLRCLGMTKAQVRKYVRLEALNWCRVAIPIGLITGVFATWLLCFGLKSLFGNEFATIPVGRISWLGILSGALIGLITVLLSSRAPAKKASNVSAITAVSGNADALVNASAVHLRPFAIETELGIHHAIERRKNLILMTGSFVLSIALLFSFLSLIDFVGYLMPQSVATEDFMIASDDGNNTISQSIIDQLRNIEGVENVFARRSDLNQHALWFHDNTVSDETIDLISYDDFDLDALAQDGVLRHGTHLEKLKDGQPGVLATSDQNSLWKIGDQVEINNQKVTIEGLLKYDPFSADGLTQGRMTLIADNSTFSALTGIQDYSMILLQTGTLSDQSLEQIKQLVPSNCSLTDERELKTSGTYQAFLFCVLTFLLIILLVSALNIINCLSMSVSARIRQYGTMRALGMDDHQLRKMIFSEAITYASLGCGIGCILGIALNKGIFDLLITSHYAYAQWSIPLGGVAFVICFVIITIFIAVTGPLQRIKETSITNTINEL